MRTIRAAAPTTLPPDRRAHTTKTLRSSLSGPEHHEPESAPLPGPWALGHGQVRQKNLKIGLGSIQNGPAAPDLPPEGSKKERWAISCPSAYLDALVPGWLEISLNSIENMENASTPDSDRERSVFPLRVRYNEDKL